MILKCLTEMNFEPVEVDLEANKMSFQCNENVQVKFRDGDALISLINTNVTMTDVDNSYGSRE